MRLARRRYSATLASAVIVALALLSTACPSSSDLDRMAKASQELAHDVLTANRITAEFFTAGKMSLAAKDKIAGKLDVIGDKGEKFNNLLIELDKKYPQGTLSPQDLAFVKQNVAELRQLYTDVLADLLPFKAQSAVSSLDKHLTTIEKVVGK